MEPRAERQISSLDWRGSDGAPERDLIVRGARVLDPRTGIDEVCDVTVREGRIADASARRTTPAATPR